MSHAGFSHVADVLPGFMDPPPAAGAGGVKPATRLMPRANGHWRLIPPAHAAGVDRQPVIHRCTCECRYASSLPPLKYIPELTQLAALLRWSGR